jgi:hypothetical protein
MFAILGEALRVDGSNLGQVFQTNWRLSADWRCGSTELLSNALCTATTQSCDGLHRQSAQVAYRPRARSMHMQRAARRANFACKIKNRDARADLLRLPSTFPSQPSKGRAQGQNRRCSPLELRRQSARRAIAIPTRSEQQPGNQCLVSTGDRMVHWRDICQGEPTFQILGHPFSLQHRGHIWPPKSGPAGTFCHSMLTPETT